MADKPWKREERIVAELFGYKRALMKGTDTKEDATPEEGEPKWIIDSKLRETLELWKWMRELVMYANKKGKPAILSFRYPGKKIRYVITEWSWFQKSFNPYLGLFRMSIWTKGAKTNFEDKWAEAEKVSKKEKIAGVLMDPKSDDDSGWYVIVKLHHLLALMKQTHMITEADYEG